MAHIKKNKQVDYELRLSNEEMQAIAAALKRLHTEMDERHSQGGPPTLEMHVQAPPTGKTKRIRVDIKDVVNLKENINYMIET